MRRELYAAADAPALEERHDAQPEAIFQVSSFAITSRRRRKQASYRHRPVNEGDGQKVSQQCFQQFIHKVRRTSQGAMIKVARRRRRVARMKVAGFMPASRAVVTASYSARQCQTPKVLHAKSQAQEQVKHTRRHRATGHY